MQALALQLVKWTNSFNLGKFDLYRETVPSLKGTSQDNLGKHASAIYLQVSTIIQALIFVTRSRSWSFIECLGIFLVAAFFGAQLVATLIAVYADWSFAVFQGIGWGWVGVVWLYNIVTYIPIDFIKFLNRYTLSGRAWDRLGLCELLRSADEEMSADLKVLMMGKEVRKKIDLRFFN
ncbi:hypothetical protein MKW98_026962, partial [Papaver atlanticum]